MRSSDCLVDDETVEPDVPAGKVFGKISVNKNGRLFYNL